MAGSSGDCLEADLAENQLSEIEAARAFAQAIIDTVREPVLVLDQDLRVITASRSFYRTFKVGPEDTEGRLLYELGDGHWDIPKLRLLLERIAPENSVMEDYEVEYEFPNVGPRTMCLNARKVFYEEGSHTTILLGIEDVTRQRVLEREKDELLRQKDVLLEEIQHRVANSLQIIASIILLKAKAVDSDETRSSARRSQAGHVGCGRTTTPPCICVQRVRRNGALSLKAVRGSRDLDDRGEPANLAESVWRRRQCDFPSGREPRIDRHRTCNKFSKARIQRKYERWADHRCV